MFLLLFSLWLLPHITSMHCNACGSAEAKSTHYVARRNLAAPTSPSINSSVEVKSLIAFKHMITKDPFGALASWEDSADAQPCLWNGITCDSKSGIVVAINLTSKQLQGSITPLLSGLYTSLAYLDLSNNALSGVLPPELGLLKNLEVLQLRQNQLTGIIPSSLGNCSHLKELDFSNNQLSGDLPIDLGTLTNLRRLNLYANHLKGNIPADLSNCTSLIVLDLSANRLTGYIPKEMGVLSHLQRLVLAQNMLTGSIPASLFNSSAMTYLDLEANHLTGNIPNAVTGLAAILFIGLASNQLTGGIPAELGELNTLQSLDLQSNLLAGAIPSQLASCAFLYQLLLNDNNFTGSIPPQFGKVLALRILHLHNNLLTGTIPASLGNCTNLEDLQLDHNMLSGSIPLAVASLRNLQLNLSLSHNLLRGSLPSELGTMMMVQVIDLAHNMLSGSIPETLGQCSGLQLLDLSGNNLTGGIPKSFGQLQSLQYVLNLSHNSIGGVIPAEIGDLRLLTKLDLAVNTLSGPLPPSLGSLPMLSYLNVSFNRLSGCLPKGGVFRNITAPSIQGNNIAHSCSFHKGPLTIFGIIFACVFAILFAFGAIWCYGSRRKPREISYIKSPYNTFSAQVLHSATNGYCGSNEIGKGGFSTVYRGDLPTGQIVAVKVFNDRAATYSLLTECETFKMLRHRNLVKVLGVCSNLEIQALVLEFMRNGSLAKHLYEGETCSLSWERRLQIAMDVADGLEYLHHNAHAAVVHCDLKPANILLDDELTARLADFGLANFTHLDACADQLIARTVRLRGTFGYIAPEYARYTQSASTRGDVYSYGVILLELLTRTRPTSNNIPVELISLPGWVRSAFPNRIVSLVLDESLRPEAPEKHDQIVEFARLGLLCVQEDPKRRPTMQDVKFLLTQIIRNEPHFRNPVRNRGLRELALQPSLRELGLQPSLRAQDPESSAGEEDNLPPMSSLQELEAQESGEEDSLSPMSPVSPR